MHILEISLIQKRIRRLNPDWTRGGAGDGGGSLAIEQHLNMNAEIGVVFLEVVVDQLMQA